MYVFIFIYNIYYIKNTAASSLSRSSFGIAVLRSSAASLYAALHIVAAATSAFAGAAAAIAVVQVVGGVGCNLRLQWMLQQMAERRGCGMGGMDERYCIDNGAMIAYVGSLMFKSNSFISPINSFYRQRYRTDEVEVTWR